MVIGQRSVDDDAAHSSNAAVDTIGMNFNVSLRPVAASPPPPSPPPPPPSPSPPRGRDVV